MNRTVIAFDTNIWISLVFNKDIFTEIKSKVESGDILLVISDITKLEWQRNRLKIIQDRCKPILKAKDDALKLSEYIIDAEEKEQMVKSIETSSQKAYDEMEKQITSDLDAVEELLYSCDCFDTEVEDKLYVANLAIEKKKPFDGKKNNFNDALLARSFCKYAAHQKWYLGDVTPMKYNLVYVSDNPKDFIDPITNNIISEITDDIKIPISIINTKNIANALNLSEELIDNYESWVDYMVEHAEQMYLDRAYLEWEISKGK